MLFRQRITVWTDYGNLTFKNTEYVSTRVLRQHLLLEDYGVDLQFIQREKNEDTDMLSRNEFNSKSNIIVDTLEFEAMMYEMHSNELDVPIDYLAIYTHQRYDKELSANKKHLAIAHNYKL